MVLGQYNVLTADVQNDALNTLRRS